MSESTSPVVDSGFAAVYVIETIPLGSDPNRVGRFVTVLVCGVGGVPSMLMAVALPTEPPVDGTSERSMKEPGTGWLVTSSAVTVKGGACCPALSDPFAAMVDPVLKMYWVTPENTYAPVLQVPAPLHVPKAATGGLGGVMVTSLGESAATMTSRQSIGIVGA